MEEKVLYAHIDYELCGGYSKKMHTTLSYHFWYKG